MVHSEVLLFYITIYAYSIITLFEYSFYTSVYVAE
jgi:hypothetical protein